jgi:hypothetical protein
MGGRAVEGTGLENRQGATPRGFESHPIRHTMAGASATISASRRHPNRNRRAPPGSLGSTHLTRQSATPGARTAPGCRRGRPAKLRAASAASGGQSAGTGAATEQASREPAPALRTAVTRLVGRPRPQPEQHWVLWSAHAMYLPPLAESVEPVMKPASSPTRNTTQRATSSGSPRRPTGISGRDSSRGSSPRRHTLVLQRGAGKLLKAQSPPDQLRLRSSGPDPHTS